MFSLLANAFWWKGSSLSLFRWSVREFSTEKALPSTPSIEEIHEICTFSSSGDHTLSVSLILVPTVLQEKSALAESLIELGLLQTGWECPHIPFMPVVGDDL